MRQSQKTLALWALLIVVVLVLFQLNDERGKKVIKDMNYPTFVTAVEKGHINTVTFNRENGRIKGEVKPEFETQYNGSSFDIVGNTDAEGFKIVREKGLIPKYESSEGSMLTNFLISWLPMILIFGMFIFFMKQLQAGGGKAMSFGKSRAKMLTENKLKVTFKDVAGVEEAKEELEEIVQFLKDPKKFTRLGGRIPKGVLLVGSPGTGKTLLARAIAGEAGVPFFTIAGSDFVEMFVGVGASRVRDLFEQGKKNAPCIIFIDEIDAVGRHRGAGMGGGHDEREQTLNQLLVEMDGFEGSDGVILIAATNRPDVLDPALLRPGRFDRRVVVPKPDILGRELILKVHSKKVPLSDGVDLNIIAKGTPGFSGADLENLVNESALYAARKNKHQVDMNDFEIAKDKILMGGERRSMVISEEDRRVTAFHEAGHTIVGQSLKGLDPIHKVTIVPRGMALGVTQTLPEKEMLNMSKTKATSMIAFLFGGRAAEEVALNDVTTGASNDIERATELARSMVCEWGMSDKIGPISLEKKEGPVFLGMQSNERRDYSDEKAKEIDLEVDRLIGDAYKSAKKILKDKRPILDEMAKALLELETITGKDVQMLMDGDKVEALIEKRATAKAKLEEENERARVESEKKEAQEEKKKGSDPVGNTDPVTA